MTKLEKARRAKNLRQSDVARLAGCVRQTVARAEQGKKVYPYLRQCIVRAVELATPRVLPPPKFNGTDPAAAGRIGGAVVSADRAHMAEIGRRGGMAKKNRKGANKR